MMLKEQSSCTSTKNTFLLRQLRYNHHGWPSMGMYNVLNFKQISQFRQYQEEIHQDLRIELNKARNEADKVTQRKNSEIMDLERKVPFVHIRFSY